MAENQRWAGGVKVEQGYSKRSIPDIAAGTPLMEEENQTQQVTMATRVVYVDETCVLQN